jgi:hypothetical protein
MGHYWQAAIVAALVFIYLGHEWLTQRRERAEIATLELTAVRYSVGLYTDREWIERELARRGQKLQLYGQRQPETAAEAAVSLESGTRSSKISSGPSTLLIATIRQMTADKLSSR